MVVTSQPTTNFGSSPLMNILYTNIFFFFKRGGHLLKPYTTQGLLAAVFHEANLRVAELLLEQNKETEAGNGQKTWGMEL